MKGAICIHVSCVWDNLGQMYFKAYGRTLTASLKSAKWQFILLSKWATYVAVSFSRHLKSGKKGILKSLSLFVDSRSIFVYVLLFLLVYMFRKNFLSEWLHLYSWRWKNSFKVARRWRGTRSSIYGYFTLDRTFTHKPR